MVIATRLLELPVRTIDGSAGTVEDAIIRERDWSVRAVVVTMRDGAQRRVIIPRELLAPTQKNTIRLLPVLVTRDELETGVAMPRRRGLRPRSTAPRCDGTSLRALLDYRVRRSTGEEWRLRDAVLDPRGWHVRRFITAGRWWPFGSDQRIEPRMVSELDHEDGVIHVEVDAAEAATLRTCA